MNSVNLTRNPISSAIGAALMVITLGAVSVQQVRAESATSLAPIAKASNFNLEDFAAPEFNTLFENFNGDSVDFNGEVRETLSAIITGYHLVFEEGHENGLWERYHDAENLKELVLHADTVTIRGQLNLPMTEVTVFASRVYFEDSGTEKASINTEPTVLDFPQAASRQAGRAGYAAGDIHLNIQEFALDDFAAQRFYLQGGNGQKGGNGINGANGAKTTGYLTKVERTFTHFDLTSDMKATYVYWPQTKFGEVGDKEFGSKSKRPANGKNATAPGVSGKGGASGSIFAPTLHNWLTISNDLPGGSGGVAAPTASGGSPGAEVKHWTCRADKEICSHDKTYYGSYGKTYYGNTGTPGDTGEHLVIDNPYAWLSADVADKTLSAAETYFVDEDYENADRILAQLIDNIESYMDSGFWESLNPYVDVEVARARKDDRQARLPVILDDALDLHDRVLPHVNPGNGDTSSLPEMAVTTLTGLPSASRIFGGATHSGNGLLDLEFGVFEPVNVNFDLIVPDEQVGDVAGIYIVSQYNGVWYMKNASDNWVRWDGSVGSLLPNETRPLTKLNAVNIISNMTGLPGVHRVFCGHSSADGNISYNQIPLDIYVR